MSWTSLNGASRRKVRFLAVSIAVCLAAATAAYWALPNLVPEHRLRAALASHMAALTAGEMHLREEDAKLSLSRGLTVTLDDAVFTGTRGGSELRLDVASIEASIRPLPLIFGRTEIERLALDGSRFRFVVGRDDATTPVGTPEGALIAALERAAPTGDIILTDASIVHEGAAGREVIRVPDLRMAPVPESTAVLLTGGVLVGERLLRIEGRLEDPAAVFSDSGSDARLVLRRAQDAEDAGATPPQPARDLPKVAEESRVASSLRRMAATVGLPADSPVIIEGRFALTPRSIRLSDATMAVAGVVMAGNLTVSLDGTVPPFAQMDQTIRQALAAWSGASAAIEAGEWRAVPLSLGWLAPLDVDLDARVRNGGAGATQLESGHVRLEASDARARLEVAANSDLGRLETELTFNVDSHAKDAATGIAATDTAATGVAATGRIEDVVLDEVGRVVLDLLPPPLVSPPSLPQGTLDAEFDLAARGATLGELVSALDGSLVTRVQDGSIAGADVVLTLEGLAQGRDFMSEEDGPLIPAAGRTAFDTVEARADFEPDAAHLAKLNISGDRYVVDMSGDVDLGAGGVRVEGRAVLLGDGVDADNSGRLIALPFGVGGTLAEPVVAPGVPRTDSRPERDTTRGTGGSRQ